MLPIQLAAIIQRHPEPDREAELGRLATVASRLRPPLRHQVGVALIRLGTRVRGAA